MAREAGAFAGVGKASRTTTRQQARCFLKLIVEAPPIGSCEPIRLSLAGGRELTLPASMPVEQIARLVRD